RAEGGGARFGGRAAGDERTEERGAARLRDGRQGRARGARGGRVGRCDAGRAHLPLTAQGAPASCSAGCSSIHATSPSSATAAATASASPVASGRTPS